MLRPLVIDLETSSGDKRFGPDSKLPSNDYYTIIYGEHPDEITTVHNKEGFKRTLPEKFFEGVDILVGQNFSFDLGYIWHTDSFKHYLANGGTVWCTAQAEYILSGQRHKFPSLAELQEIYLGQKIKQDRISKLFKKGIGADKILSRRDDCRRIFALYETYCRDDGATTLQIFAAQYRRAKKEGCLDLIKMHMKGLLATTLMQKTGMHIDRNKLEVTNRDFKIQSLDYLEKAIECTKDLWDEKLGPFNINSPKQKSAMLFGGDFKVKVRVEDGLYKNGNPKFKTVEEVLHIDGFDLPTKYTTAAKAEGCYVTDAAVLQKIINNCGNQQAVEYCKLQKKAMNYGKMCSTYLEPFLELSIQDVLYPNYNTTLTATSRLSSSKPNFQNVPASGDMCKAIQGQLVAPEGYVCIDIDYNSLEIWVLALLSGDETLLDDLQHGVDLHVKRLSWIPRLSEGKSYEELMELIKEPEWALKRKKAKGISFKKAYGGGARSLAEAEGLEVEDVQAIFDEEDRVYWKVKEFNDELFEGLKDKQELSRLSHFSKTSRAGRQFEYGIELLPIYIQGSDQKQYRPGEYRHFSSYTSLLGHKFTFEEFGQINRNGQLVRKYSTTETKNYHIQGTAGDIVQMGALECMYYVLENQEEVRMVRTIHDALSFYIKKGTEEIHIPELQARMEEIKRNIKCHFNIEVPFDFKTEAKIGPNFGEMVDYKGQVLGAHYCPEWDDDFIDNTMQQWDACICDKTY